MHPSPLSRKHRLFIEQQRKCHWCGIKCHLNNKGKSNLPDLFTEDHIFPRGRGGDDSDENVVGACHKCNNWRNSIEMKLAAGKSPRHIAEPELRKRLMPVMWEGDSIQQ